MNKKPQLDNRQKQIIKQMSASQRTIRYAQNVQGLDLDLGEKDHDFTFRGENTFGKNNN